MFSTASLRKKMYFSMTPTENKKHIYVKCRRRQPVLINRLVTVVHTGCDKDSRSHLMVKLGNCSQSPKPSIPYHTPPPPSLNWEVFQLSNGVSTIFGIGPSWVSGLPITKCPLYLVIFFSKCPLYLVLFFSATYFSPRRGCPRVFKCWTEFQINKKNNH